MILPTLLALSLAPTERLAPEFRTSVPHHELITSSEPPQATEQIVEQVVLDNFNTGEVDFQMPSNEAVHQVFHTETNLPGVLGGTRYTSLTSQKCALDPLYCSDTRINTRGSGVLSVAHSELVTNSTLELTYEVSIGDLREYRLSFVMLSLDKTASESLKITVIVDGVEYPVNKIAELYSLDFADLPTPTPANKLTIRFSSVEADDYVLDEINMTRTYTIEPAPVPAFGFLPALGALAALGGSEHSLDGDAEHLTSTPNAPPTPVPEGSTLIASGMIGSFLLITKFLK
jgi:hypothetical protein